MSNEADTEPGEQPMSTDKRPCIKMQIRDGALHYSQIKFLPRREAVTDLDIAIGRLINGEIVWVQQRANLCNSIQRTLETVLRQPAVEQAGDD